MKNYRPFFFWLFFVLLIVGAALSLPSSPTAASGFPPRPTATPTPTAEPSLPTPKPSPTAKPISSSESESQSGAFIYLHVPSPPADLQTVVQWQDGLGEWHDIEGWRGTLNESNFIVWWVAPGDLGAVWYRWQVYTADGRIATTSDAFSLPSQANQTLHILITLAEA